MSYHAQPTELGGAASSAARAESAIHACRQRSRLPQRCASALAQARVLHAAIFKAASRTGVDATAIWEWGTIHRVVSDVRVSAGI